MKIAASAAFLVATTLGLPFSANAQAPSLFFVTESDSGVRFFVDSASITPTSDAVSLTAFLVFPQVNEDGIVGVIIQEQYSCTRKARRPLEMTYLYDDQSVRTTRSLDTEWQQIAPETTAETMLEFACRR